MALKFLAVNPTRILVLVLMMFAAHLSMAQEARKWTLEQCIEYAMAHNINVRQAQITAQIAKNDKTQSVMNVLPQVDASASYNFNFGNSLNPVTYSFVESNSQSSQMSLTGTLPLFTGLQQIHNIQRAKYDLIASDFDYRAAQNNISLNVSSAYLQILLNQEIVGVMEKQRELSASQKANTESRVKSGVLPEYSMYQMDAQLARDEANLINAKGAYDISVLTLKQLLQLNDTLGFALDIPNVNVDNVEAVAGENSTSIYNFAVSNQPTILSAQARINSADAQRKMALGNFSPTLSFFTQLSTGYFSQDQRVSRYDTIQTPFGPYATPAEYAKVPVGNQFGNNFRKIAGFQLSIPIFGKGQRFTNLANAKLQTQLRVLQLESAKNILRQDIEQAYNNARIAAESYYANKKSYESALKSQEMLDKRYRSGLSNEFELQQAKNTLSAAESEMAKAKYTYVFRLKVLDFYKGKKITLN